MPVTAKDLQDADQKRQDIAKQVADAESALQTVLQNPDAIEQGPAAKARVDSLRHEQQRADANYSRVWTGFKQAETAANRPVNPTQQQTADKIAAELANKEYNLKKYQFYGTDAEYALAISRLTAKPPNEAELANANTNIREATERARHNVATEGQSQTDARIKALTEAGQLTNVAAGQVYNMEDSREKNNIQRIQESRTAGQSLLTAATTAREQNISQQKSRSEFISGVTNGVFSGMQQLMRAGSNGSEVATAFARAYLTMANQAYTAAGLDKDIPPVDMNTPEMQNLREIAKWTRPQDIPHMPDQSTLDWRVIKSLAARGFPPPGYNGPIGPEALALPDDPGTIRKYTGKTLEAAQKDSDIVQLTHQAQTISASVADIRKKDPATRTAEEQAQLSQADAQLADLTTRRDNVLNGRPGATSELGAPGDPGAGNKSPAETPPNFTNTETGAFEVPGSMGTGATANQDDITAMAAKVSGERQRDGVVDAGDPRVEAQRRVIRGERAEPEYYEQRRQNPLQAAGAPNISGTTPVTNDQPPSLTGPDTNDLVDRGQPIEQQTLPERPGDPQPTYQPMTNQEEDMPKMIYPWEDTRDAASVPMPTPPPAPEPPPDYSYNTGPDPSEWWTNSNTDDTQDATSPYNWRFLR